MWAVDSINRTSRKCLRRSIKRPDLPSQIRPDSATSFEIHRIERSIFLPLLSRFCSLQPRPWTFKYLTVQICLPRCICSGHPSAILHSIPWPRYPPLEQARPWILPIERPQIILSSVHPTAHRRLSNSLSPFNLGLRCEVSNGRDIPSSLLELGRRFPAPHKQRRKVVTSAEITGDPSVDVTSVIFFLYVSVARGLKFERTGGNGSGFVA